MAAAERRQAKAVAERAVLTGGLRRDISPEEAILEEVQWCAGHVQWLRSLVQALAPEDLVWGLAEEKDVGSGEHPGVDTTRAAKPSVWWDLYVQERKELRAWVKEAREAKIEERRIRIAENIGETVASVLRGTLVNLQELLDSGAITSVDPSQPDVVRVLSTQLRALGAPS